MSLIGSNNEEKIWNYLKSAGFNDWGIAGLLGNLYAESGLIPTNMQDTYEKKIGYTDATYTAAVDSGKYKNFVNDGVGYGIAQWTFPSRKEGLLAAARTVGKSVGDLEVQLTYLLKELSGYSGLLYTLKTTRSLQTASDMVLTQFERPADQSGAMKSKRASYGQQFLAKYGSVNAVSNTAKGGSSVSVRIAHARGGDPTYMPGNQTGSELAEANWYNGGWTVLLRPKSSAVAESIADAAVKGVRNKNIGYGQGDRNTARAQAKLHSMRLDLINKPCNCDCTSFASLCAECAGAISEAQYTYGNAPYSENIRQKFRESGKFDVLTDAKYLTSQDYLKRGDILVNEPLKTGHAVVVTSNGIKAGNTTTTTAANTSTTCPYPEPYVNVKRGSVGTGASWVQWQLNRHGASLDVDGEFGPLSEAALIAFQRKKGLEDDGICGPLTRAALKAK